MLVPPSKVKLFAIIGLVIFWLATTAGIFWWLQSSIDRTARHATELTIPPSNLELNVIGLERSLEHISQDQLTTNVPSVNLNLEPATPEADLATPSAEGR
jgi:hypothetical protein